MLKVGLETTQNALESNDLELLNYLEALNSFVIN